MFPMLYLEQSIQFLIFIFIIVGIKTNILVFIPFFLNQYEGILGGIYVFRGC